MSDTTANKTPAAVPTPLPEIHEWDAGFWQAAKEHRLVVQCCAQCKLVRSLPRLMCPSCRSFEHTWLPATGKARLYSWSTLYRAFHPAFAQLPHTVAVVALEDYPQAHLVSSITLPEGMKEEDLVVGMPLEVFFRELNADITLPEFRLVTGG